MRNFKDRVAVITGAGGGIGSAIAENLANKGCHLALLDINQQALDEVKAKLASTSVNITTHIADVTDKKAYAKTAQEVLKAHGGINILVNNAGITLQKEFNTHSLEDLEWIIGINLWGVVYGCHFFKEALEAADEAHVINLSSMAAFAGFPSQSTYCMTKKAVQGLSDSLWAEWQLKGIGVTSVHPGAIRTNIIMATLEASDNVEAAKRNNEMAMKTATAPEKAADLIAQAIAKNKKRLLIGLDAKILNFLAWIAPGFVNWAMKKIAQKINKDMQALKASS